MSLPASTKYKIIQALDELPPESLTALADYVEFLRAKHLPAPRRIVSLGGIWEGYSFTEEETRRSLPCLD